MQFLILGWMVLELTDSASRMGFMVFLYGLPTLGFVLFGGNFCRPVRPAKPVDVDPDAGGRIGTGSRGYWKQAGLVALWHVYVSAFFLGLFQAINTPARVGYRIGPGGP